MEKHDVTPVDRTRLYKMTKAQLLEVEKKYTTVIYRAGITKDELVSAIMDHAQASGVRW